MLTVVLVKLPTFPSRYSVSVMIFRSFQGSLDLFTSSQSISVLGFIKQMFQIGMENAVRTCPCDEKRERNLNKRAVVTVNLL